MLVSKCLFLKTESKQKGPKIILDSVPTLPDSSPGYNTNVYRTPPLLEALCPFLLMIMATNQYDLFQILS